MSTGWMIADPFNPPIDITYCPPAYSIATQNGSDLDGTTKYESTYYFFEEGDDDIFWLTRCALGRIETSDTDYF